MIIKYLAIFFLPILFLPLVAFASTVSVTQDVTIILPSDSSQYLLKSNSSFESASVAVTQSSFSCVMNPGDTVTITSADDRALSNSLSIPTTCGSPSSVTLTVSSAQTITVTPGGTCTTPTSSGGSAGNGPPVGLLGSSGELGTPIISTLLVSISTTTPAVQSSTTPETASSTTPLSGTARQLVLLYQQLIALLEKELSLLQPQT
jgi:hypothetical protein